MLRYTPGQYYKPHHDYIPQHRQYPFGPRVYTFFLYLSDVESGGETRFPKLNISVQPKKGRALLWPSVYDDRPLYMDSRTTHEARPVVTGTKYAGNLWQHPWNFKKPHKQGCAP
jgi:prolyl 4-hydroxylase